MSSSIWQCPRCNKVLSSKQRLVSHLSNRLVNCCSIEDVDLIRSGELLLERLLCKEKEFKCKYCQQQYSQKCNLYRHEKRCSTRTNLENEVARLKSLLDKQQSNNSSNNNSTNPIRDNVANNGIQNNISVQGNNNRTTNINIIVPFGTEDISNIITLDWLKNCRPAGINPTILEAIKAVHFNPDNPKYMNVYVSNLKDKICKVFNALGFWMNANKDETIDEAYVQVTEAIQSLLDSLDDDGDHGLQGFSQQWERFMQRDVSIQVVRKDIEKMMANLKEFVKSVHHIGKWAKHR